MSLFLLELYTTLSAALGPVQFSVLGFSKNGLRLWPSNGFPNSFFVVLLSIPVKSKRVG